MSSARQTLRSGMTLVEMLVATAATLLLMAAVAQSFGAFSGAMSNGRAILETDSRLRNVAQRLRDDLDGVTTRMLPPRTPGQGEGYFELIEGPRNDLFDGTLEDLNGNANFEALAEDTVGSPRFGAGANNVLDVPSLHSDLVGDIDDVLLFTTQSKTSPFVGRSPSGRLESQAAEVAWFARPTTGTSNPPTYTLYRKQLLVMGYVANSPFSNKGSDGYDNDGDGTVDETDERPDQDGIDNDNDGVTDELGENDLVTANSVGMAVYLNFWENYYLACDVSVRRERGGTFDALVPNTLSDLTRRENRFLHNSTGDTTGAAFPYAFASDIDFNGNGGFDSGEDVNGNGETVLEFDHLSSQPADGLIYTGAREGEDIILTNVLGFDVRVFDPAVPIQIVSNTAIVPGDDVPDKVNTPGRDHLFYFTDTTPQTSGGNLAEGTGAYVDLGHNVRTNNLSGFSVAPLFSGFGNSLSGLAGSATTRRTYCTWSTHYEANGIDEDDGGGGPFDEGTDGLDNNSNSLVDESDEQETSPPYPYPLRGIEVRIRVYEPRSRQVRQVTVRHTFVPH